MYNKVKLWRATLFPTLIVMIMVSCASVRAETQVEQLYTAYNIWYEPGKEANLWCINYKVGMMIPAGTKVTNVALGRARKGKFSGGSPTSVSFITVPDGKRYWVNINKKFHPGKSINDYKAMMFTNKTFEELTNGLQKFEIEAIKKGVVVKWMSKDAALISYGPPPEHRTPNYRDFHNWIYWMNRFKSKEIYFDENNKAAVRQKDPDEL